MQILFFLIFLCFLCSFSQEESSAYDFDPRLTVYSGECASADPEATFCLPYAGSLFLKYLSTHGLPHSACLSAFNQLLESGNSNFEAKEPSFSLFSKGIIKANHTLVNISTKSLISSRKIDRRTAFPGLNPREFFYSEVEFESAPHDFQLEFRLIHNLLFHMAFLEESLLREDLLCLPRAVSSPVLTFTDYEVQYLLSAELSGVETERKTIRELFFYFKKLMGNNYEVEHRKKLFFGESEPRLDDFVYLYSLVKGRLTADKKLKVLYLPPFFHHIPARYSLKDAILYEFSEDRFIVKTGNNRLPAGTEVGVLDLVLPNMPLFLYRNQLPDENQFNCYEFEFFTEEHARELKEPKQRLCLRLYELGRIKYWFVMGSMLNYKQEKQRKKCREYLNYRLEGEVVSEVPLEELMDAKYCPYVAWDTIDVFEQARRTLGEMAEAMRENVRTVKGYKEFREGKVEGGNADGLERYYQKTVEYFERIREEIKLYDDINEQKTIKNEL